MHLWSSRLTYFGLGVFCLFIMISFSLTALSHIALIIPCIYAFILVVKEKSFKIDKSTWSLIGLFLLLLLSTVANYGNYLHPFKMLFKLKYFAIGILSVFAYGLFLNKKMPVKTLRKFVGFFLLGSSLATISGIIALKTGFNPLKFGAASHVSRASGMYGMPVTYAYALGLIIGMLLVATKYANQLERYFSKWWIYVALVVSIFGLYFSGGRGALFAIIVAIPFIFFRNKRKIMMLYFTCMVGGLLLFAYLNKNKMLGFGGYREDSKSFGRSLGKQSGFVRLGHGQAAFFMALENPIFGIGFRNFENHVREIKQKYNLPLPNYKGHGHSNINEVLGGAGFFALILYLLWMGFWLNESLARGDIWGEVCFAFILIYFVAGLFQSAIIDGETQFFLMTMFPLSKLRLNFSS